MARKAIRGRLLDFTADPAEAGEENSYRYIADGAVVMEGGRIVSIGLAADLPSDMPVDHYPDALVMPGLIDTHIHYPQTRVIASYGAQLLEWLNKYTFVEEQKFGDPDHAASVARFFFDELLRNGTTTAAVYCTPISVRSSCRA
jgi:guanine deaminase